MTPTESTTSDASPSRAQATTLRRQAAFVVAAIALLVVLWALFQGADRSLFESTSTGIVLPDTFWGTSLNR